MKTIDLKSLVQTSSWKEQFLELYMSGDAKKFGQALELKRLHMPKKLYRYRALSDENIGNYRKSEIIGGELYMSHPNELNDPFEVSSKLGASSPSAYMKDKEMFISSFKELMSPDDYEDVFTGDDWYEKLAAYVAEKSAPADNLPMWHHYTNGHTGICLEYDTESIENIYQINRLFPVFYVDKMPDMPEKMFHKRHPQFGFFEYLAIHKLKDWSYENEWRLVFDAGSWYYGPEDVSLEFWTQGKTIPFIRPTRIILGMKISKEHEKIIREYAKLAEIPVVKAIPTEYGLKVD